MWVVFSPYVGACFCVFNPNVGLFLALTLKRSCVSLTLTWVVFSPYVGRVCVPLSLTWVVFCPYVGEFLCIFNPYVGCLCALRGRVLVYL